MASAPRFVITCSKRRPVQALPVLLCTHSHTSTPLCASGSSGIASDDDGAGSGGIVGTSSRCTSGSGSGVGCAMRHQCASATMALDTLVA